jgi:hypothetical protein
VKMCRPCQNTQRVISTRTSIIAISINLPMMAGPIEPHLSEASTNPF